MDIDWNTVITMLTTLAGLLGAGKVARTVAATAEQARRAGRDAAAAALSFLQKLGISIDEKKLEAWLLDKIDDLLDHAGLSINAKTRREALRAAKVEIGRLALVHELDELRRAAGALDIEKVIADATARGRARVQR